MSDFRTETDSLGAVHIHYYSSLKLGQIANKAG